VRSTSAKRGLDLERVTREDTGGKQWKFYFNSEPSESAKLENFLGSLEQTPR
jgi:hypothetical protein